MGIPEMSKSAQNDKVRTKRMTKRGSRLANSCLTNAEPLVDTRELYPSRGTQMSVRAANEGVPLIRGR